LHVWEKLTNCVTRVKEYTWNRLHRTPMKTGNTRNHFASLRDKQIEEVRHQSQVATP
jgi:hypothetical protein